MAHWGIPPIFRPRQLAPTVCRSRLRAVTVGSVFGTPALNKKTVPLWNITAQFARLPFTRTDNGWRLAIWMPFGFGASRRVRLFVRFQGKASFALSHSALTVSESVGSGDCFVRLWKVPPVPRAPLVPGSSPTANELVSQGSVHQPKHQMALSRWRFPPTEDESSRLGKINTSKSGMPSRASS